MIILNEGCTPTRPTTLLNSGVTGRKFTRFTYNVASLSQMNLSKSEWRYYNLFRNSRATN